MAGFHGDASIIRRGVRIRTVKAFPFETNAPEDPIAGAKTFLEDVYSLTRKLRVGIAGNNFEELYSLTRIQISSVEKTLKNFEEICETLISLLYFGFLYADTNKHDHIKSILTSFLEKWFDTYDTFDYEIFIISVENSYKTSNFASVLLLYFHYYDILPVKTKTLINLLPWKASEITPPQWLKETLSCSENVYKYFNQILYRNLAYNKCILNAVIDINYLSTYSKFLDACEKYYGRKYEESIALFSSLSDSSCSKFLLSWKELMIGLNLEHLKRYEQALLAYKEALGQYELCYYALYFSARIFKVKGNVQAYLDCLRLLSEVGEQTNSGETVDNSLHKFLLSYHVPLISNLSQRNKLLLASAYFEQQRWRDAKDELFEVLSNWKYAKNIAKSKILQTSDQFPDMPPKNLMKLCYLTSLINLNEFEVVVSSPFATETVDNLDTNAKELDDAGIVTNICAVVGSLVIVEAFYRLEKYESALTKSGSVLITVEKWSVSSGPFSTLKTFIKVYLYKMLSLLYSKHPFNMWKNSTHFSRLQDHCLKLLQDTTREVFCPASQLVYKILKHRIESFRIKLDNSSNS